MKTLIVYESFFGNTEKIARAVAAVLASAGEVQAAPVADFSPAMLSGVDLLIVGSPTRAFSPTDGIKKFLKDLPAGSLNGMRVAVFDTRMSVKDVNNALLTFMAGIFGYAAKPVAVALVKKGAARLAEPAGFFVTASEGPLKDGELERAAAWAADLKMV